MNRNRTSKYPRERRKSSTSIHLSFLSSPKPTLRLRPPKILPQIAPAAHSSDLATFRNSAAWKLGCGRRALPRIFHFVSFGDVERKSDRFVCGPVCRLRFVALLFLLPALNFARGNPSRLHDARSERSVSAIRYNSELSLWN